MENTRMDDKFNYEELNKEDLLVMVDAHEAELESFSTTPRGRLWLKTPRPTRSGFILSARRPRAREDEIQQQGR